MAQLIDKSAVVAEIEKMQKSIQASAIDDRISEKNIGMYKACVILMDFLINTLEVKEVDLEEEYESFLDNVEGVPRMWHSDEQIEWGKDIAKHFFELGLSVNNPTTAADRGMAEEIITNLKRLEKDYLIDLTKEMEWLRKKTERGASLRPVP